MATGGRDPGLADNTDPGTTEPAEASTDDPTTDDATTDDPTTAEGTQDGQVDGAGERHVPDTHGERPEVPYWLRGLDDDLPAVRENLTHVFDRIDDAALTDEAKLHAKVAVREKLEQVAQEGHERSGGRLTLEQSRERAAQSAATRFDRAVGDRGAGPDPVKLEQHVAKLGERVYAESGRRSWDNERAFRQDAGNGSDAGLVDEVRAAIERGLTDLDNVDWSPRENTSTGGTPEGVDATRRSLAGVRSGLTRQIDKAIESGATNRTALNSLRESMQNTLKEIELAGASTEVDVLNPDSTAPGGHDSEMDVVTHNGTVWKDSKNFQDGNWDLSSDTWTGGADKKGPVGEAENQLHIASHGDYRAPDGTPPRLEWHFWNGVHDDVRTHWSRCARNRGTTRPATGWSIRRSPWWTGRPGRPVSASTRAWIRPWTRPGIRSPSRRAGVRWRRPPGTSRR